MDNKTFFSSTWARASDYEVINNHMIIPKKGSKIEYYDIILENQTAKSENPNSQLLIDLLNISKLKNKQEIRTHTLKFAKKWGLPCLFLDSVGEIYLHPRFIVADTNEDHYNIKEDKQYNVINPSETFIEIKKNNESKETRKKNKKYFYSSLRTSLHYFDPTRIALNSLGYIIDKKKSRKDARHIIRNEKYVAQQIIYNYEKGKWNFNESSFVNLKNKNLNVEPFQLVDKNNIKSKIKKPGYTFLKEQYDLNKNNYFFLNKDQKKSYEFIPFLDEVTITNSSGKREKLKITSDLVDHFPRLSSKFSNEDKKYNDDVEEFFCPMPGTSYFYENYAERISDISSLASTIALFFDFYLEKKEKSTSIGIDNKNNDYDNEYINLYNDRLLNMNELNSDVNIGLSESSGEVKYEIRSKSMAGIITHILAEDHISDKYLRRCVVCRNPIVSAKRESQQTCGGKNCISTLTSRRYDAKERIRND